MLSERLRTPSTGGGAFVLDYPEFRQRGGELNSVPNSLPATEDWATSYTHLVGMTLERTATPSTPDFYTGIIQALMGGSRLSGVESLVSGFRPLSKEAFMAAANRMLFESPVEPGFQHPFDNYLSEQVSNPEIGDWLRSIYSEEVDLRPSILMSVGRLEPAKFSQNPVLMTLLVQGLKDSSLRIREAAVRAIESLGAVGRDALAGYTEPVPWLRAYVEKILTRQHRA